MFRRTYKYVKTARSASKEIESLSSEILTLRGILSRLEILSAQLEDEPVDAAIRTHQIYLCHKTLERVKAILDRDESAAEQGQRLNTLKTKLSWPFKATEVKDLIVELQRHKGTLSLALNADGLTGILQALSKQDDIIDSIQDINRQFSIKLQADIQFRMVMQRQDILASFGNINAYKTLEMNRKLRHPNTGLWFTEGQDFGRWMEDNNTRLWLYGIPGAGKSVLAAPIIDETLRKRTPHNAVAFFFCDFRAPATQEPSKLFGCLIQQLARQDEGTYAKVEKFYKVKGSPQGRANEYDAAELCHLISEIATDFDCTIVVVDGIDECGKNAAELVELLVSTGNNEESNIKTLLLSRNEPDICEKLEGYPSISIAANSSDLRLYVDAELEHRIRKRQLHIKSPTLKEHIRDRLVQGADDMYVHVYGHSFNQANNS